jgi:hypothetical protein
MTGSKKAAIKLIEKGAKIDAPDAVCYFVKVVTFFSSKIHLYT